MLGSGRAHRGVLPFNSMAGEVEVMTPSFYRGENQGSEGGRAGLEEQGGEGTYQSGFGLESRRHSPRQPR